MGRLGLPGWFRHFYFEFHAKVRLRFKLAAGTVGAWTRDGEIPQGCPLSMVFIAASLPPWCKCLEIVGGVKLQLYADNIMCVSINSDALLNAARISDQYIHRLDKLLLPPRVSVLVRGVDNRRMMKSWVISGEDDHWKVELDVRNLGGHLDSTPLGRAGTNSGRTREEMVHLAAVGALPLGFLEGSFKSCGPSLGHRLHFFKK